MADKITAQKPISIFPDYEGTALVSPNKLSD